MHERRPARPHAVRGDRRGVARGRLRPGVGRRPGAAGTPRQQRCVDHRPGARAARRRRDVQRRAGGRPGQGRLVLPRVGAPRPGAGGAARPVARAAGGPRGRRRAAGRGRAAQHAGAAVAGRARAPQHADARVLALRADRPRDARAGARDRSSPPTGPAAWSSQPCARRPADRASTWCCPCGRSRHGGSRPCATSSTAPSSWPCQERSLAPPGPKEIVDVRHWACGQVLAQLQGRAPPPGADPSSCRLPARPAGPPAAASPTRPRHRSVGSPSARCGGRHPRGGHRGTRRDRRPRLASACPPTVEAKWITTCAGRSSRADVAQLDDGAVPARRGLY